MANGTVVLLGDSILDNAPYTTPEPDSTAHLTRLLPGWKVARLAQDGATMGAMEAQLGALTYRPDVAVLSVGGNDALEHIRLLDMPIASSAQLLAALLEVAEDFEARYKAVTASVSERAERTVVCTIYEVQLRPRAVADLARIPLGVLNDRIVRVARQLGLEVLELRDVCTEPSDFVLEIEPSAQGAAKIASAIAEMLTAPPRDARAPR